MNSWRLVPADLARDNLDLCWKNMQLDLKYLQLQLCSSMYGLQFQSLYHHNKFPIKTNSLYVLICNWAKVFVSTNCYKAINLRDCTLIHCIVHHIQLKHNIKSFVIIALSVDFWLITLKTIAWWFYCEKRDFLYCFSFFSPCKSNTE